MSNGISALGAVECEGFTWLYTSSLILLCNLCVLAFTLNLLLPCALARAALIDANVKWLLANVSVASTLISVHVGIRSVLRLFEQCPGTHAVTTWRTQSQCALEELVFMMANFAVTMSICMVGVERLVAAMQQRYRESNGCLGYIMAMCSWFGSSVLALVLLAATVRLNDANERIELCLHAFVAPPILFVALLIVSVAIPLITVAIYTYLYWSTHNDMYKFGINMAAPLDLAARFQIRCNLDTARMMMPSVLTHALCSAAALPAILFYFRGTHGVKQAIGVNLVYLVCVSHCIVHCASILAMSRSVRRAFLTVCQRRFISARTEQNLRRTSTEYPVVNFHRSPDEYNDVVTTLWNSIDMHEQDSL